MLGYAGALVYEQRDPEQTTGLSQRTLGEARLVGTQGVWEAAALRVALDNAGIVGTPTSEQLRELLEQPEPRLRIGDFRGAVRLGHVAGLLRERRPDYDRLPDADKRALLVGAARHQDELLRAADNFDAYLEHGGPEGLPKSPAADAQNDLRAAELRGALVWTYRRIGEELGVPLPGDYGEKGDFPAVRRMAARGNCHLKQMLGETGHEAHIEHVRPALARFFALSEEERYIELTAELMARWERDTGA